MKSVCNGVAEALAWFSGRRLAGRDLYGNKYYEILNPPGGGRPKRSVKYKEIEHLSDYTTGKIRLPVQWRSWLSHTRTNPPTLEELQADQDRQARLSPLVAAIEERERKERIRQGYLKEGEVVKQIHSHLPGYQYQPGTATATMTSEAPIPLHFPRNAEAGPSTSTGKLPSSDRISYQQEKPEDHRSSTVPTPTTPGVPPPTETVDPALHASKEDLRKLAEEDTKRRMGQTIDPSASQFDGGGKANGTSASHEALQSQGTLVSPRHRRGSSSRGGAQVESFSPCDRNISSGSTGSNPASTSTLIPESGTSSASASASADDLRRLSQERTKQQMSELGIKQETRPDPVIAATRPSPPPQPGAGAGAGAGAGPGAGAGAGLKPRKRGKVAVDSLAPHS